MKGYWMMRRTKTFIHMLALMAGTVPAYAGNANVVDAKAHKLSDGTWRFDVTVQHDDTGWDHYANKWEILDMEGNVLATRVLAHPHVNEQPFTRSLSGVHLSEDISSVIVRASDKVHGHGEKTITIQLNDKN